MLHEFDVVGPCNLVCPCLSYRLGIPFFISKGEAQNRLREFHCDQAEHPPKVLFARSAGQLKTASRTVESKARDVVERGPCTRVE